MPWREATVGAFIVMDRQADLFGLFLQLARRAASRAYVRREQETDQHGNDGDHDEQFDERSRGRV